MRITKRLFPSGKTKALTLSYDDSVMQDIRLIEILNKYNIKATFNLNSGTFGQKGGFTEGERWIDYSHMREEEVKDIYKGHEVAVHTLTHPWLTRVSKESIIYEVIEDKKNLEELVGYPIRGMAYPYGAYNGEIIEILRSINMEYARNVVSTHRFDIPKDFLNWDTTCHHNDLRLLDLAKEFIEKEEEFDISLFYLWGHSFEFDKYDNWHVIEEFCEYIAGNEKIWYATNTQIVDYVNAQRSLKFSSTGSSVYNPTGIDIWLEVDNKEVKITKGETINLGIS